MRYPSPYGYLVLLAMLITALGLIYFVVPVSNHRADSCAMNEGIRVVGKGGAVYCIDRRSLMMESR